MDRIQYKERTGRTGLYSAAFMLPVAMFLALCALRGTLPFGDESFLAGDMANQYIKFFGWFKDVFAGENDPFYTFSKTLGGDTVGLWAYYLLSPLNLIFLFVDAVHLPAAATALIALKLGLCGLCAAIYLLNRRNASAAVLIFSTAYAFMSYNLCYFNNIMWLDGVYILPLMLLGIDRICDGQGWKLYFFSLAYALITNYYIGYMLCIFSVLWFACGALMLLAEKKSGLPAAVGKYAGASLLSGAVAAFVLIPTALSLSGTKASYDAGRLAMYPMYTLRQHLSKFVCGAVPTGMVEGDSVLSMLPHVYCGAVVTAFFLLYFFNHNISRRRRLCTAALFLLLALSFNYNGSYVIWHAFNYPAWFPYRNAFLLCLLMIYAAWQCFINREGIRYKNVLAAMAVLVIFIAVLDPVHNKFISRKLLLLDMAAVLACYGAVLFEGKLFSRRLGCAVLAMLQLALLFINAAALVGKPGSVRPSDFAGAYRENREKASLLQNHDDGFYRVGWVDEDFNYGMLLSYDGLSHFSSTEKSGTKEFAVNFGFLHFQDVWVRYCKGSTEAADAFMGFKYIVGDDGGRKNYPILSVDGGEDIRVNPNALGISMLASEDVLSAALEQDDIFKWQNQVYSSVLGSKANILLPQTDVETDIVGMYAEPFDETAVEYKREENADNYGIVYRFTVTENKPLYIYTSMPYVEGEVKANLFVNGEDMGAYMGSYDWRAVYLGTFQPGDELEVMLRPNHDYFLIRDSYFYYEDTEELARCCEEIKAAHSGCELLRLSDSHLKWTGTVTADKPILMLTVPNEHGWTLTVDGEETPMLTALGLLIAVELEPGEHSVELRFEPAGLRIGIIITTASLLVFALCVISSRRKRKK